MGGDNSGGIFQQLLDNIWTDNEKKKISVELWTRKAILGKTNDLTLKI